MSASLRGILTICIHPANTALRPSCTLQAEDWLDDLKLVAGNKYEKAKPSSGTAANIDTEEGGGNACSAKSDNAATEEDDSEHSLSEESDQSGQC